jgi:hypothetical protein
LTNDAAERAAVELAMQGNGKRNLPAPHYDVTAALPHALEAVFAQEIAQLRARKDAQLRHASHQAL